MGERQMIGWPPDYGWPRHYPVTHPVERACEVRYRGGVMEQRWEIADMDGMLYQEWREVPCV